MDEQTPRPAGELREVLLRAAVAEGVSLLALGLVVWLMGGGGIRLRHLAWRARQYAGRARRAEDAAVGELRADISAWEHGQAAAPTSSISDQPGRKSSSGGCGCAGAM